MANIIESDTGRLSWDREREMYDDEPTAMARAQQLANEYGRRLYVFTLRDGRYSVSEEVEDPEADDWGASVDADD